jgi:hypothetical protein
LSRIVQPLAWELRDGYFGRASWHFSPWE